MKVNTYTQKKKTKRNNFLISGQQSAIPEIFIALNCWGKAYDRYFYCVKEVFGFLISVYLPKEILRYQGEGVSNILFTQLTRISEPEARFYIYCVRHT